jgi:hypothetical protein
MGWDTVVFAKIQIQKYLRNRTSPSRVKNPENDPVGVDRKSTLPYILGINLLYCTVVPIYPSPEPFSLKHFLSYSLLD